MTLVLGSAEEGVGEDYKGVSQQPSGCQYRNVL